MTQLDGKVGRFRDFVQQIATVEMSDADRLARTLMWAHSMYMLQSQYREHISEDGAIGTLSTVWMSGSLDEMLMLVRDMAHASEESQKVLSALTSSGCVFPSRAWRALKRGLCTRFACCV